MPGLLERSVARGWNVVVQSGTEERRDAMDQHLWIYAEESFLGARLRWRGRMLTETPVMLTTTETNPNAATVRFLVDGAVPGIAGCL